MIVKSTCDRPIASHVEMPYTGITADDTAMSVKTVMSSVHGMTQVLLRTVMR